jgi:hypothetical protein
MPRQVICRSRATTAPSLLALAMGAAACGAIAIGALAIGQLVVGRLIIKRARFGTLELDQLTVRRLRILDHAGLPPGSKVVAAGLLHVASPDH